MKSTIKNNNLINCKSYLSKRGYILRKKSLKEEEIDEIKKDLFVKPNIIGDFADENSGFKVYQENEAKFYLPKFYGIEKFGLPEMNNLNSGKEINCEFVLSLREEQKKPAEKTLIAYEKTGGGILSLPCALGKCFGYNTPIKMYDGSVKYVQNIIVGDILMGDDNEGRTVLSLANGEDSMYRVTQDFGGSYVVNSVHILSLFDTKTFKIVDIELKEYLKLSEEDKLFLYGYKNGDDNFKENKIILDEYITKYGSSDITNSFTTYFRVDDKKILDNITDIINKCGYYSIRFDSCNTITMFRKHISSIKISYIGTDNYYGFEIDGNRRFKLWDNTIVHNTIISLYFVSKLKRKTLVIVHKEFLLNQWIDRIKFAIPSAKIGIIQGDKYIVDADIVLGMLQTLSMKNFPPDTFDDFGHVIIDECHRIPSKVFSQALQKVNSKYMLGLSATPNRKDGLTKILKWYIGDICFSMKSHDKNTVQVERYLLESKPIEEYNKEIITFRGRVMMPTMINNICSYYNRTKLIINIIKEKIEENQERQILVLSDRKQQLEDIFIKIKALDIDVGYYIGGMKRDSLKKSESCRVLLGTYPMANEGLDIPSLNALILASPKSDIVQSIGRIVRQKHENVEPLIIDIIDIFSIFDNQSRKRLSLYSKKKFEIKNIYYDLDGEEIDRVEEISNNKTEEESDEKSEKNLIKSVCLFSER